MKQLLSQSAAYIALQRVVGADRLRYRCIDELAIAEGETVVDVGCGPAYYFERLPQPIDYHGFDTAPEYIGWADKRWGDRAHFHLGTFDADADPLDAIDVEADRAIRWLDTRETGVKVGAGETIRFDATAGGFGFSDGAVVNVTAVNTESPGFLTVYPCDDPLPATSVLKDRRPSATLRWINSSRPGSKIGISPRLRRAILSSLTSTHVMRLPESAKQVPTTRPT